MAFDLYAWAAPRDLDAERAAEVISAWEAEGGDPATSPFEPSTDIGWFHRELIKDHPDLETITDAMPRNTSRPVWLETEQEAPARVVGIRLSATTDPEALETIYGLATKYDLVLYEAGRGRIHTPLQEMADYAAATFWPRGAIQAALAGVGGAILAGVAWLIGIPIVSGILIVIGAFLAVMAVYTFVHEIRRGRAQRNA